MRENFKCCEWSTTQYLGSSSLKVEFLLWRFSCHHSTTWASGESRGLLSHASALPYWFSPFFAASIFSAPTTRERNCRCPPRKKKSCWEATFRCDGDAWFGDTSFKCRHRVVGLRKNNGVLNLPLFVGFEKKINGFGRPALFPGLKASAEIFNLVFKTKTVTCWFCSNFILHRRTVICHTRAKPLNKIADNFF